MDLPAVPSPTMATSPPPVPQCPIAADMEFIRLLGSGASAEVWLAHNFITNQPEAVKLFHKRGLPAEQQRLFEQEIQTLANLDHPMVVRLHRAVTTADGRLGFAMDWVDGPDFAEWLELHETCSPQEKLGVLRQIAEGVGYLHASGVLHRDLKPANVMVNHEGKAKIVDFGLARLLDDDEGLSLGGRSLTDFSLTGTLAFMAPEQANRTSWARRQSADVWPLGLMLYRVVTGQWFINPKQPMAELLPQVCQPRAVSPAETPAKISRRREMILLLEYSLARDPALRYQNGSEFARDLGNYLEGRPLMVKPPTIEIVLADWLRRRWKRATAAAMLLAAVVGFYIFSARQERQFEDAKRQKERELQVANQNAEMRRVMGLKNELLRYRFDGIDRLDAGAGLASQILPNDEDWGAYSQAVVHEVHASIAESRKSYPQALGQQSKALDYFSEAAKRHPTNAAAQLDAAASRYAFALISRELRYRRETSHHLETALTLVRMAKELDNPDPRFQAILESRILGLKASGIRKSRDELKPDQDFDKKFGEFQDRLQRLLQERAAALAEAPLRLSPEPTALPELLSLCEGWIGDAEQADLVPVPLRQAVASLAVRLQAERPADEQDARVLKAFQAMQVGLEARIAFIDKQPGEHASRILDCYRDVLSYKTQPENKAPATWMPVVTGMIQTVLEVSELRLETAPPNASDAVMERIPAAMIDLWRDGAYLTDGYTLDMWFDCVYARIYARLGLQEELVRKICGAMNNLSRLNGQPSDSHPPQTQLLSLEALCLCRTFKDTPTERRTGWTWALAGYRNSLRDRISASVARGDFPPKARRRWEWLKAQPWAQMDEDW